MDKPGLTDADYRKLGDMARYGIERYTWGPKTDPPPTPDPDRTTCEWCKNPTPMGYCTRCAAEEFLHHTNAL